MKNLIIVFIAVTLATTARAQKISADKIPPAVTAAFNTKFPKAEKVKWEMEDKKDFEANFKIGTVEQSATFNPEGKWVETETEIEASQLPQAIQQAVAKQFAGYKTKEASQVENEKNGSLYEVEVAKGKEIVEISFSPKGDVLGKKVKSKEDKEDKD
jgi:hypothetical protein